MKLRVRWKILLATTAPLVALAVGGLIVVDRNIARRVHESLRDDLRRAAAVFETLLSARSDRLAVTARVIVADPRFFSTLTLPGTAADPQLRATVSGVASEFGTITGPDLFEVFNAEGELLASVGPDFSSRSGRSEHVRSALEGRAVTGVLIDPQAHYQVAVTPVYVGGRVVGSLLLGDRIGRELAEELRSLTRSEVSFFSGSLSTGSTLENAEERQLVLSSLQAESVGGGAQSRSGTVTEVRAGRHVFLTLARELPDAVPGSGQLYVLQRALDTETTWLREMQTHLVELGLLAILLSLIAGYFIAERITAPLLRLVRGAEEMERGNYDFPLAGSDSDEVGYLTARFVEMRQRLRSYVRSLESVARLKTEFISVASHELRTPISVVNAYQELLATGQLGPVTSQQQTAVDAIGRAVKTLTRTAENATRMAQIESARLELEYADEDAIALLERAASEVRATAPDRRVSIEIQPLGDPGRIQVDGARFAHAISQLISNGVRFTPDGGSVTLTARREAEWLELEVRDTGNGMSEERIAQLADRSVVVHDASHHHSSGALEFNSAGLGLGLAIARGIVEHHRGTLTLASRLGHGTVVTLRIPVALMQLKEAA
ncbi:MAG: HAMP domain-containing protein [Candidatus Eisenbacteria bacterium]|uniref:histidine kinase n=1 Tax=Eiseniibacteriota bacterium TaxID=2212470 RepID=A0A849SEF4_UNCEI|nr:HAMP domain-containing protein [Candidatus Eisenbacteria bacterium]